MITTAQTITFLFLNTVTDSRRLAPQPRWVLICHFKRTTCVVGADGGGGAGVTAAAYLCKDGTVDATTVYGGGARLEVCRP